jgi:hypothetical protein
VASRKPKASRAKSSEIFLLGRDLKSTKWPTKNRGLLNKVALSSWKSLVVESNT